MSLPGRLRTGADAGLQAHCQKLSQHDLNGYFERPFWVACRPLPPQFQKSANTETRSLTSAENGALGGTRTPNPLLRRQMLCPLSYEGVPAPYRNSRPPQTPAPRPTPQQHPHRNQPPQNPATAPPNARPAYRTREVSHIQKPRGQASNDREVHCPSGIQLPRG